MLIKVRLLETLSRHVGKNPGDVIEVSHKEAIFLEAHGFGEFVRENQIPALEGAEQDPPQTQEDGTPDLDAALNEALEEVTDPEKSEKSESKKKAAKTKA